MALSTLSSNIYSDFAQKKNGIDRADAKAVWENAFAKCRAQFGSVMADSGNAYAFPYVTHIYNAPLGASGFDIEDEAIPFYQIVLHGLVSYSTGPLNLNAVPEDLVLKAVETGSSLSACLMYAGNETLAGTKYSFVFSGHYGNWVDTLAAYYGRTAEFLRLVAGEEITGHRQVQRDVYRTEFSDGTVVYVNYREKAAAVDGVEIPSRDFIYVKGGVK